MNNSKYYNLCCKALPKAAWAFKDKEDGIIGYELIPYIIANNSVGFPMHLKMYTKKLEKISITKDNVSEVKHLWVDFCPTDSVSDVMSLRMKELIESHLTGEEGLVWVPVDIIGPEETRIYYIPRFTKELDVLNEEKTKFNIRQDGSRSVFIPSFSREKLQKYNMFFCPETFWQIPTGVIVNENIKKAIQKAKLTGVGFEEARVE